VPVLGIGFLALVAYVGAIYLLRRSLWTGRDHRVCRACGYDLRAATRSARCPECGGALGDDGTEWASRRAAARPLRRLFVVLAVGAAAALSVSLWLVAVWLRQL
jgi:predicted amidophosphoribosyltransferase